MAHDLDRQQRVQLLKAARKAVEKAVQGQPAALAALVNGAFSKDAAVFVTITERGMLRGCIGTIEPREPLHAAVTHMAQAAAMEDPRFPPVMPEELEHLEFEISILSPMTRIKNPEGIQVGKHGLKISHGYYSGLLLPQVATEQGWDRLTFLEHCCLKAGLPPDAWQRGAEICIFSAEVFNERGEGLTPHPNGKVKE